MDTRISPVHARDAEFEACPDGSLLVRNPEPLRSYPERMTERLEHWAARVPGRPFVAARSGKGWRKVSYAEALAAARAIGQGLLDSPLVLVARNEGLVGLAKDRTSDRSQFRSSNENARFEGSSR